MHIEPPVVDPSRILPEPEGVCPECGGRGWKIVPDGGAGRAERCDCSHTERGRHFLAHAGIPPRYRSCTLDSFKTANVDPRIQSLLTQAHSTCKDFVGSWFDKEGRHREKGLAFVGASGTGKTHLAAAVLAQIIQENKVNGVFVDWNALIKQIKFSFDRNSSQSEEEILKPILRAELLVLDDLGVASPTDWMTETLYHVLNTRYAERRATILTTNYRLRELRQGVSKNEPAAGSDRDAMIREAEGLKQRPASKPADTPLTERISARLVSRIHQMTQIVELPAFDYRINILGAGLSKKKR